MLLEPELLLADEVTASLDPRSADAVMDLLLEQCGRGAALLLVTHDPVHAARCTRRVDAGGWGHQP